MSNNVLPGFSKSLLQEDHVFATLLGKSNSGKSHFLKYLLSQVCGEIASIIIFSETMRASGDYEGILKKKYIHPKYNPAIIEKLFDRQTAVREAGYYPPLTYVIFDDCCSHREYADEQLRRLAVSGRHYRIKVILTSQYPYLLPPVLRCNSTHLFVFNLGDDTRSNQTLYEWVGTNFKLQEFKEWAYKYLKNYNALYIRPGNDEALRLVRAPEKIPKFRIQPM